MTKIKLIVTVTFAFLLVGYYAWPIAMIYVVTDIGKSPNVKIDPRIFTAEPNNNKLQTNGKIQNFGLIKAGVNSKHIVEKTIIKGNAIIIEYSDYIFKSSKIIHFSDSRMSFDVVKNVYKTLPSDVLGMNSLQKNLKILENLYRKYVMFGSEPDELIFIEIINKPEIKGIAYLYKWDGEKPKIELAVYTGKLYTQSFVFESKTANNVSIIKERYSDFVKSMIKVKGSPISQPEPMGSESIEKQFSG